MGHMETPNRFNTWLVLVVLILLGILLYAAGRSRASQPVTAPAPTPRIETNEELEETIPPESEGVVIGENAVFVSDQRPGNRVEISLAVLKDPGYVAIHRVDENGSPGRIIGNSSIIEGTQRNIIINLSENIEDGAELFAMLHDDDGDAVFEFPGSDAPIRDVNEDILMMRFTVRENAQFPIITP